MTLPDPAFAEPSLGRRFGIGVATIVAAALTVYVLVARPFAAQGMPLLAEFGTAGQGLRTSSPVKIRGMRVGQVSKVALAPDGRVRITFRIDRGIRIPDSVTASLEPESVFGPKFVNLLPGDHETSGPYLSGGARITRTSDPSDLSDLIKGANSALAAADPEDLATTMNAIAQGLGGQGKHLRETIDDVDRIVRVAHDNRRDARVFAADLARLARIRGAGDDLGAIVSGTDRVIAKAASGNGRLRGTAAGLSRLSALMAHGVGAHGDGLREGFRSAERISAVFHSQLGLFGPAVRSTIELAPIYRQLTWVPAGVGGKHMLAGQAILSLDLCETVLGSCPADGPSAPRKGGR